MQFYRFNIFLNMLIINLIMQSNYSCAFELPEAKITVKVVAEDGKPMSGEEVSVGFAVPEEGRQGIKDVIINGFTDPNGLYAVSHKTIGIVGSRISKDGYYGSYGEYRFTNREGSRWLPWNSQITLVLRKKEKPVPMYHRELDVEIPIMNKQVGFDLVEYDWVAPYGKGKHADLIFKLEKKFISRDEFDSTLTVTFSEKHDGIQVVKEDRRFGSSFKLSRFAPKNGYHKKVAHFKKRSPGKPIEDDYADDNNYIFRIRSEEKDGRLWKAMYGKILGEIRFDPMMSKTAFILFEYYLNPDYTRNLEHGKNLFENLKN